VSSELRSKKLKVKRKKENFKTKSFEAELLASAG
jgi:hypothetical protein